MQVTSAGSMPHDQPQHLRWVFWNGADCVLLGITALQELPMKELAQKAHTGKCFLFLLCHQGHFS